MLEGCRRARDGSGSSCAHLASLWLCHRHCLVVVGEPRLGMGSCLLCVVAAVFKAERGGSRVGQRGQVQRAPFPGRVSLFLPAEPRAWPLRCMGVISHLRACDWLPSTLGVREVRTLPTLGYRIRDIASGQR